MFKHLVVPLDGSTVAEAALPTAVSLTEKYGSQLTLISVVDVPAPAIVDREERRDQLLSAIHESAYNAFTDYMDQARLRLAEQGLNPDVKIVEQSRSVAATILKAVDELGADAIVMSTHGRGGLSRWVFGSVADKVLRLATCPVVVIPARAIDKDAPSEI